MKITNFNLNFKANKMSKEQAKHFDKELSKANMVDIICHNMTDRDGANSALLMWDYLTAKGIDARIIIQQKTPELLGLRTLDCNIIQATNTRKINEITPDIAFCVDFCKKERVKNPVLSHIKKAGKVMGFDHHDDMNIVKKDYVHKKAVMPDNSIRTTASYYVDSTAKSATSVIYRYFEALGKNITQEQAYDMFLGLVDDCTKRGVIDCDGEKGIIKAKKELQKDKNAYEIYLKLKSRLSDEQIAKIAKNVDIISSLNKEQQEFKNSLEERLKFSENGKIAYVEIPSDSKEWQKLGGDNTITSTILNRFRREILSNEKYKDVEIAITFYEANGNYRLSAHSKSPVLLDYFQYIEDNKIPNFTLNSGGHSTRGGGGISTLVPDECHKWVTDIVSCDEFLS